MSSSRASTSESIGLASVAAALGFDAEAALLRDPGILLNPHFLGALHAELEQTLGPDEGAITLVQIGFLHGLRDATCVLGSRLEDPRVAAPATPAPLPIRFRSNPHARPRGAIELHGCWPARSEASARLARLGAAEGCGCWLSAGYTSGWLSGIFEANLLALETTCSAAGHPACRFVAREAEVWRTALEGRPAAILDALPFDILRSLVASHASHPPELAPGGLDAEEPVVHIWGPVMVIPFSGTEEALTALGLTARDPGAAEVSVIVIDLAGAIIDEAFGAVALEQIIESVESWGGEVMLANASSLALPVIAGLERQPLMVHKDLNAAIACAFQIAELRRRPA